MITHTHKYGHVCLTVYMYAGDLTAGEVLLGASEECMQSLRSVCPTHQTGWAEGGRNHHQAEIYGVI